MKVPGLSQLFRYQFNLNEVGISYCVYRSGEAVFIFFVCYNLH